MQAKEILTDSRYATTNTAGTAVTLTITRAADVANTISAYFNNGSFSTYINNKRIKSGELHFVFKNMHREINAYIEEKDGELFIQGEDAKNYSLNHLGELIYTFR